MASSAAPQNRYRQPRRATLDLNTPPLPVTVDGRVAPGDIDHHRRHLDAWARRIADEFAPPASGGIVGSDTAVFSGGTADMSITLPSGTTLTVAIWVMSATPGAVLSIFLGADDAGFPQTHPVNPAGKAGCYLSFDTTTDLIGTSLPMHLSISAGGGTAFAIAYLS